MADYQSDRQQKSGPIYQESKVEMASTLLSPAFRNFLDGLDGSAADEVISVLQRANERRLSPKKSAGISKTRIGKTNKRMDMHAPVTSGAPKRPVNRWMGFRQYYNGSLEPHTQMNRSKILKMFWDEDLFQEKWNTLVLAYKEVRGDRSKDEVPLGKFLSICAPLLGIIPPEEYQQVMGWLIITNPVRELMPEIIRNFRPAHDSLPDKYLSCPTDVAGLVAHCRRIGFGCPEEIIAPMSESCMTSLPYGQLKLQEATAAPQGLEAFDPAMADLSCYDPYAADLGVTDHGNWTAYSTSFSTNVLADLDGNVLDWNLS